MESADEYHIQQIINITENVDPALWPQCCIYNVPASLFKVKEEAYTPLVISIGPIHHNNKKLKEMQEQKQRYFHFFWERLFWKHDLISYKAFLEQEEQNIRHCYQKKFPDISKQQFVHMIMLDAVFIMELFLREAKKWDHKDDPVVTQPCLGKTIQRDMLLLENQLPIYVLEKLFDTVVPQNSVKMHTRFVTLAHQYLASCYPYQELSSERKFEQKKWEKSLHFTDLVRYTYLPMKLSTQHKNSEKECVLLRTATKLSKVGVSFEKFHNRCLLDIKFEKKIFRAPLQIPQLKVDHTTECVLRNLIAFEQCHYPEEPYICNYVSVINSLIRTKDDAELLVEKEAIVHELRSDEDLATLVNSLCKNVVTNSTCYRKVMEDLNEHYNSDWNRTLGTLKWVYFKDPWRSSSTVLGIAVLIFIIFTLCRIISDFL